MRGKKRRKERRGECNFENVTQFEYPELTLINSGEEKRNR